MQRSGASLLAAWLSTALAVVACQPLGAEVLERERTIEGGSVRFKVVLPTDYDPSRTYPGILAFGGGPQTIETVEGLVNRNLRTEAERRGYIVIAPAAPDGELFFRGGADIIPAFLAMMLADYRIEDGKFHAAGPSNGGIAALHVAATYPEYFRSVTAFPGYLWQPTEDKLAALDGICVFMYIGEMDPYPWHDEMQREAKFLTERGSVARYAVETGQAHRLETLAGEGAGRLFDGFETARGVCRE